MSNQYNVDKKKTIKPTQPSRLLGATKQVSEGKVLVINFKRKDLI